MTRGSDLICLRHAPVDPTGTEDSEVGYVEEGAGLVDMLAGYLTWKGLRFFDFVVSVWAVMLLVLRRFV